MKETIYATLAQAYKWTHDYIADLTPYQQLVYLNRLHGSGGDELTFASHEDYTAWYTKKFGRPPDV